MQTHNHTLTRGCSAEMLVALRFAERGYVVAFPLRTCSYDLVVDDGDRSWKIQVKQGVWLKANEKRTGMGDRARWTVDLQYKKRQREQTQRRRREAREFDWLAAVCGSDRVYVIPVGRLMSPDSDMMLRAVHIKPEVPETARADSRAAAARWAPFLNDFGLRA